MAERMTKAEYLRFLAEGGRTGKLATGREDGQPHVVPIWFVMDGEMVVFNTGADTTKGRNIRRDPRVALCIDDERPPFAFVLLEGIAEISTDLREMLPWATRIAERYMGAEQAEAYGRRNAVEGELLVRVRPTRVIARRGISD